jgi:O-antigen biosynthesis protein WbqP
MSRFLELILSLFLLIFLSFIFFIIFILIKLTSFGPAIHWSKRVGVDNIIYLMPKFRTMRMDTPNVATHLLQDPNNYTFAFGRFLRSTSLDELPQIYSIIIGDMTFVGPRPALFNQYDLINLRSAKGLQNIKPGITGLAQINGRDLNSIHEKVQLDEQYMKNKNFFLDIKIVLITLFKILLKKQISH